MFDSKLYVITNRYLCKPKPLLAVVSEILDVGVKVIQLREKDLDDIALLKLAQPISEICKTYNAHLLINTNVKIAEDVGAFGIHLPDIDVSVGEVKEQSRNRLWVGCSVHGIDGAERRETEGADFITFSPIYQSKSKPGYGPAVGIGSLEKLVKQVNLPVFALGGLTPDRAIDCLAAGATGVAVMSGIMSPTDAAQNTKSYLSALL